jgi:hypothetical protein
MSVLYDYYETPLPPDEEGKLKNVNVPRQPVYVRSSTPAL